MKEKAEGEYFTDAFSGEEDSKGLSSIIDGYISGSEIFSVVVVVHSEEDWIQEYEKDYTPLKPSKL